MTMYAQAVSVLQQEVYETPLPGGAQQSFSSPPNVLATSCIEMATRQADPVPDDDESGPTLPILANGLFGVYRKPEALESSLQPRRARCCALKRYMK